MLLHPTDWLVVKYRYWLTEAINSGMCQMTNVRQFWVHVNGQVRMKVTSLDRDAVRDGYRALTTINGRLCQVNGASEFWYRVSESFTHIFKHSLNQSIKYSRCLPLYKPEQQFIALSAIVRDVSAKRDQLQAQLNQKIKDTAASDKETKLQFGYMSQKLKETQGRLAMCQLELKVAKMLQGMAEKDAKKAREALKELQDDFKDVTNMHSMVVQHRDWLKTELNDARRDHDTYIDWINNLKLEIVALRGEDEYAAILLPHDRNFDLEDSKAALKEEDEDEE